MFRSIKIFLFTGIWLFSTSLLFAAEKASGQFELGARTTASLFNQENQAGVGTGGQFRIRFLESLSSEWFADYITNDIQRLALREDAHIGWSIMFYPFEHSFVPGSFTPYILAGHCFDYTRIARYSDNSGQERISSAVQAGFGTHYHLSERFNFSVSGQYMLHLGDDIHADINSNQISITRKDLSFEGHLLVTFSLNYRLGNLW